MRMRRQRGRFLLVGVLLAASACSSSGGQGNASGEEPSGGGNMMAYDPPTRFDTSSTVTLPRTVGAGRVTNGGSVNGTLPIALHRTTVFIAEPDGLSALDGVTGRTVATIRPANETTNSIDDLGRFSSSPVQPPVLAEVGGRTLVAAPVTVNLPGSGTSPDQRVVEVLVADADTGQQAWTVQLPLPRWAADDYYRVWPAAVGAVGTTLVLTASADDDAVTYGLDLVTRQLRWQKDGVSLRVVADGLALGFSGDARTGDTRLIALEAQSGAQAWAKTSPDATSLRAAGPSIVIAVQGTSIPGERSYTLRAARTGEVLNKGNGDFDWIDCLYDAKSMTVCRRSMFGAFAGAFDATTGKWLWSLPDKSANRVAPSVTTAWHGVVYGETKDGPLLIDARTGRDRPDEPGFAPYMVNERLGVGLNDSNDVVVHPAVG